MSMISLHNPFTLKSLLERYEHHRPSLLLIRSESCPPCVELHPQLETLAGQWPRVDFYEFNVDTCADPQQDFELTQLFQWWGVKYLPSQIFLATGLTPDIISTRRLDVIERKLHALSRPAADLTPPGIQPR
ncbi:thioredoxin family protein [Pseudomonas entomophila]|uniref:thioredoxin family protein n=1 Tax=Pseudomonas entomophila TaxID=312306 RepID=UPI0023D7E452|nr:thioredoxin family protein [Pseudomonas entomophila]MDF0731126.1 thioredoxin family protein [Pseudomonas entomophila]